MKEGNPEVSTDPLRDAINEWLLTRDKSSDWSGPPEWTAEDGYNAAVEEVRSIVLTGIFWGWPQEPNDA